MGLAGILTLIATPAFAFTLPDIEPIHGVSVDAQTVTLRMGHAACTRKSDLTVAVGQNPPRPLLLIARKHPATCADGGQTDIVYTLEELGLQPGQPFSLANPLVGAPAQ